MPLTTESLRKLQKKTSQTMLGAQRRAEMESNRLARELSELRAVEDRRDVARRREFRQAERQLALSGLALSDSVIDVPAISGGRPRAVSSAQRRRQLDSLPAGLGDVVEATTGRRRRPRQRRPLSVFAPQADRQRQLMADEEAAAAAAAEAGQLGSHKQQQQQQKQQPQPAPSCQFAGSDGSPCGRFPCCLPASYSFISSKREMLQLYDLLLSQLPEHRRPKSGADSAAGSDLSSMISDAEYVIEAQKKVSSLDPVERARLLKMASEQWRRRHSGQMPQPRETRYGKPYPMRRVMKPISSSSCSFLN
ncbi:hypothetical protein BOX15_Mlig012805g1 [Macrostomum lignano]|uniref:Uncharacterized protein n=1 Tax=Macrostomum lignano TaxID=282301 RepID=A0A267G0R9_9PLAT|nr:hypothetical protein BOX15_Mlig012805g1 [Macrostomum lignano]